MRRWVKIALVGGAVVTAVNAGLVYLLARDSAKSDYVDECSHNAGRALCECLWEWYERNVSDERRRELHDERRQEPYQASPEALRADAECSREEPNAYVESCVDEGGTRALCACVWRWFLRNVPRERAKALHERAVRDPGYVSPQRVRAAAECRAGDAATSGRRPR